ncbi:glucose-6-phosphate isomerase [Spiroplasma turonicum]|uniref:Glucose-6-phosphate isomerase n=1 Tax=Spiroplasma turonicum TaxID=216946 RepID=A0A0K1P5A4_9MOLU|nr:glucose-6-phosphate isomerase [Spiroplasma turonicum]AKU79468.1 glucose-6-phosphate isomerase [Spiroplasma turonicum]ALX70490.1 glucose-6-phosphate isomerase [Spiroplasma turonicum]
MIELNLKNVNFEQEVIEFDKAKIESIHNLIINKSGKGSDFLGWYEWPNNFDKKEYNLMKEKAEELRNEIEVLLVVGIGGSYLGTRAADNMIRGLFTKDKVELIYIGNTISSSYIKQVLDYVDDKEFAIANISKSGTTTEPGISFRVFQNKLVEKKGKEIAQKRIVAITDKSKGALKKLATIEGYTTFTIPDDIGGRFSVFTPVGIFPLLVAGIDTDLLFKGSQKAYKDLESLDNSAYKYAITRYLLNVEYNYKTEVLVSYELQMQMFTEWWKQLFGESEGKDNKGLLPSSCVFSTDLHSLGQFIQDGTKNVLFETVIDIKKPQFDINVPVVKEDLDGLNYLTNNSFHEINHIALEGVIEAHVNTGMVPNIVLEFEKMDAEMFGYAIYWFMRACAFSGYLLEINPFDQPGVEVYKKNMFKLLKKPGF